MPRSNVARAAQIPLGVVPVAPRGHGAEDWARLWADPSGIGTKAAAGGNEVKLLSGQWNVASGLLSLPDRFRLTMGPRASIVSTLTQAGGFPGHYVVHLDAPGAVQLGSIVVTPAVGATLVTVSLPGAPAVDSFVQFTHGLSCELFQIRAVAANAGNWDLTLSRPTALPWTSAAGGDIVQIYASRPHDLEIDFAGTVTGTGDQIVQIVRADRTHLRGFVYNATGGLAKAIFGWDLGCRQGTLEDARIDCIGSDATHGQTCVFVQSGEEMFISRSTFSNAAFEGLIFLDCVNSGAEDVRADSCSTGFSISSFGVGPDGKQSFGSFDVSMRRAMANKCDVGFYVAQVGLATNSALKDVAALACATAGILVGPQSNGLDIENADVRGCFRGLLVQTGAKRTRVRTMFADGVTGLVLNVQDEIDVDGLYAVVNYAGGNGVIDLDGPGPWTLRDLRLTQQNAGGYLVYCVHAGQLVIDDAQLLGNPAVGVWVNAIGAVATISNTKIVAGQGIVVPNGATVILGDNVDLSGCASPFTDGGSPPMGIVKGHFAGNSLVAMAAADHVATWAEYAVESIQLGGTLLLAPRNFILPGLRMTWNMLNGADQAVTVKAATGTGVPLAPGASAVVTFDGTNVVQVG